MAVSEDKPTRGERRAALARKARYGMQVSGSSVKMLAQLVRKPKRR